MQHVKVIGWASLLFLLLFSSCRKDQINNNTNTTVPEPIVKVVSSLEGQVFDENMNQMAGVSIKMGDDIISTDENGFFRFINKQMNKNGTLITATNAGYFLGAKMVNPSLNTTSFVRFQLIEKQQIGSFASADGGTVSTADEASISFGSNSIMYENGTAYTGDVRVFGKWLNPDSDSVLDEMPGDLRAIDTEDELVQLGTYGMVAVELETPSGQKLQIAEGQKATIQMPIAASQLNTAPNSIPLWSFDEETGYWVEESTATIQNGFYVGDVEHFSYWNCDAPFPIVLVNGLVKYDNDLPVVAAKVHISTVNNPSDVRYGFTNSNGIYGGKMPQDELLNVTVDDNCGNTMYSGQIGPFSSNATAADIVISDDDLLIISGILEKCDASPVTNGYVMVKGEGATISKYVEADGSFEIAVNLCEDGILTVQGYDLDDLKTSPAETVDGTVAGGAVDLGVISLCDQLDEFILVEIPTEGYSSLLLDYNAELNGDILQINTGNGQDTTSFFLSIEGPFSGAGSYPTSSLDINDWGFTSVGFEWGVYVTCGSSGTNTADCSDTNMTLYEGPGGYAQGTISGTMTVWESPILTEVDVDVSFRVLID